MALCKRANLGRKITLNVQRSGRLRKKTTQLKGGRQRQNKSDKYIHSGNQVEKVAKEVGDEDEDTDPSDREV